MDPCDDYQRIARAIDFLIERHADQPSLEAVAAAVHLSPFHFQRLFSRWAGVSPKRFLQYLSGQHAREALLASKSTMEAAFEGHLSGGGRLHDLMIRLEAMTPGELQTGARGLSIRYGFHPSPFGSALIAATHRGICWLSFQEPAEQASALAELRATYPEAEYSEDPAAAAALGSSIFRPVEGPRRPLCLHVGGTNLQLKVWEALLRLPPASLVAYEDLARDAGRPTAVRAVASAVGANRVSWLIPCHRVIRKTGIIGQYRWGPARKRAMLAWEAARAEASLTPA
jgi:AraC family transcriptional regulator, regulatory protein of adaptative response / methylated-DNA-[protein]-cysteine methyltransferase